MNIFLIGMMGSGKSTVGKSLARALDYHFLDTDHEIEKIWSKSITDIFRETGELEFRKQEKKLIQTLIKNDNQVVSTGGGLACFNNTIELINESGLSIYLKAEAAFLASRLKSKKKDRPLISGLSDEELVSYLDQLLMEREGFYNQAHIKIESKNLKTTNLVEVINQFIKK